MREKEAFETIGRQQQLEQSTHPARVWVEGLHESNLLPKHGGIHEGNYCGPSLELRHTGLVAQGYVNMFQF